MVEFAAAPEISLATFDLNGRGVCEAEVMTLVQAPIPEKKNQVRRRWAIFVKILGFRLLRSVRYTVLVVLVLLGRLMLLILLPTYLLVASTVISYYLLVVLLVDYLVLL